MLKAPAGLELARLVSARRTPVGVLVFCTILCAGCASRFKTETTYVAPGFTRGSLQGRTVAVLALPAAPATAPSTAPATAPARVTSDPNGEVAGVVRGISEA